MRSVVDRNVVMRRIPVIRFNKNITDDISSFDLITVNILALQLHSFLFRFRYFWMYDIVRYIFIPLLQFFPTYGSVLSLMVAIYSRNM
jgi:hypothetical protein